MFLWGFQGKLGSDDDGDDSKEDISGLDDSNVGNVEDDGLECDQQSSAADNQQVPAADNVPTITDGAGLEVR